MSGYKGAVGYMGWFNSDHPIIIDLTQIWNKLGRECGYIYSTDMEMPKHLSHLQESINLIRNQLNTIDLTSMQYPLTPDETYDPVTKVCKTKE